MNGTNETLERQELDIRRKAINRRFRIPPEELDKTVEVAINLRDHGKEEKTRLKAIQCLTAMELANQRDEWKQAALEVEKNKQPGSVVNIHAEKVESITVDQTAVLALLATQRELEQRLAPPAGKVIEHTSAETSLPT